MGINRLRKSGLFPIEAFAVISEVSMKPLCKKYGIEHVMYKNQPLGEKKNFGLSVAMKKEFDFMIEIGSDDLLKTEFLELYPFDNHVFGLRDFIILNSETGECRRHSDREAMYGLGRAISKEALTKCKQLWKDKSMQGLDNSSMFTLAKMGFGERRHSSAEPLAIDIKSEENIWPFNYLNGIEYDFDKAMKGLSEQEVTAIKSLQHVAVEN